MPETEDAATIIDWLIATGRDKDDLGEMLAGLCERLAARGVPLWRVMLGMPAVDPTAAVFNWHWWRDAELVARAIAPGAALGEAFRQSPIYYVRERNLEGGRWRLDDPAVVAQFPLFAELRAAGATEYALRIVSFSERRTALEGIVLSMATDRPGGFTDAELALVVAVVPALSLAAYRMGLLQVATGTLGAYLGRATGGRVLQGMIRRGETESMRAALLLADLRNFTGVSESAESADVVRWLNRHLEAIGDPVAERGGEVLKFLGDGLLAVFPVAGGDPATACSAALGAARDAAERTAAVNRQRAAAGEPTLALALVLQFGEVSYGNIGTAGRLDFTVIGRAVNEASRLETLGKALGRPMVLSQGFAAHCGAPVVSLGRHALRGVAEPQEVFALAEPGAAPDGAAR
ncbi:MAG: adenylate/guanylate cyclase domain-containing protein [Roseiarcus sp.]|jgi:adenylate cyclase